jgi:SAM-dependent methyltransferase
MHFLAKIYWKERGKLIAGKIQPLIKENESVLDIGCGTGDVADNLNITCVCLTDIQNMENVNLCFHLIEEGIIPFKDKAFDVGLLISTMHHAKDKEALLKESMRVCKRLIIQEEYYESWPERQWVRFYTNMLNIVLGNFNYYSWCHVKTEKYWEDMFKDLGYKIMFSQKGMAGIPVLKNKIWVVRK